MSSPTDGRFELDVLKVDGRKVWPHFAPHHYLTGSYHGHRAFLAVLPSTGEAVAFTSAMALPHAHLKNAWRGHRTVVLPDYQGLGIGARLSDWLGEYVIGVMGGRFYSRTTHPRLGAYRDASPHWRATSSSRKVRTAADAARQTTRKGWAVDTTRAAWSHEYLGRNR